MPSAIYLRLSLVPLFWGGTFVAGRHLAPLIDPYSAALLRFLLASMLLLGWMRWRLGRFPRLSRRQLIAIVALGVTGILAYNLLFFTGLQTVEASRAALIIALNPVAIAVVSVWLLGERLTRSQTAGIAVSIVGAATVIGRGDLGGLVRGGVGRGEWLLLGCVASWTLYTVLGKRLLRSLSPLVAVSYASLAGTLMLAAASAWHGLPGTAPLGRPEVWLNIAYLAVFGTVLAFVWFYAGVQALGAARAGQFINLVPLSGVCLAAVLLDEPLTPPVLIGGLLVMAGLWLTNRRPSRVGVGHGS